MTQYNQTMWKLHKLLCLMLCVHHAHKLVQLIQIQPSKIAQSSFSLEESLTQPADTEQCQCQSEHGSPPPLHLKQWSAEMHTKPPNLLCVASDEYEWGYEYRWEKELILMKGSPPSDWWCGGTEWNQSIIVERPHDWQAGPSLSAVYTVPPQGVWVCECVCVNVCAHEYMFESLSDVKTQLRVKLLLSSAV